MTTKRELRQLLREARADAARYHEDHDGACQLVARMHAAAVGSMRAPIRGVVEDIEDLRAEAKKATAKKTTAKAAPAKKQAVKKVAKKTHRSL